MPLSNSAVQEIEVTHRQGWRWRLGGAVGAAQNEAVEQGWMVAEDERRLSLAEMPRTKAEVIVDEQIEYWKQRGVSPTAAWYALGQPFIYFQRYWPEVRTLMLQWLCRK